MGSSPAAAMYNTQEQSRTQFSLWAAMAAPLLIGSNVIGLTKYDLETYTNAEVIAVNQDALGKQATIVKDNCPERTLEQLQAWRDPARSLDELVAGSGGVPECTQVWAKPLSDGSAALVLINWSGPSTVVECDDACVRAAGVDAGTVSVYDLWEHRDLGVMDTVKVPVGADGASAMVRVSSAAGVARFAQGAVPRGALSAAVT